VYNRPDNDFAGGKKLVFVFFLEKQLFSYQNILNLSLSLEYSYRKRSVHLGFFYSSYKSINLPAQ
jgi:hypothetical protein